MQPAQSASDRPWMAGNLPVFQVFDGYSAGPVPAQNEYSSEIAVNRSVFTLPAGTVLLFFTV